MAKKDKEFRLCYVDGNIMWDRPGEGFYWTQQGTAHEAVFESFLDANTLWGKFESSLEADTFKGNIDTEGSGA